MVTAAGRAALASGAFEASFVVWAWASASAHTLHSLVGFAARLNSHSGRNQKPAPQTGRTGLLFLDEFVAEVHLATTTAKSFSSAPLPRP